MCHKFIALFIFTMSIPEAFTKELMVSNTRSCEKILNLGSTKEFCKAKKNAGKKVFQCKKKCAKRKRGKCIEFEWKHKGYRHCNSDGAKKGFYLGNCGGKVIKADKLREACLQEAAKGKIVVYCKYGSEEKRQVCSSSNETSSKKLKQSIFVKSCGGDLVANIKNLNQACKSGNYPGKSLVLCSAYCTKRTNKTSSCKKWGWKEKKRSLCKKSGKSAKLKNCSEKEAKRLNQAIKLAKTLHAKTIDSIKTFLNNPKEYYKNNRGNKDFSSQKRAEAEKRLKTAFSISKKIRNKLKNMNSNYTCGGVTNTNIFSKRINCKSGGVGGHTFFYKNSKISLCENFLTRRNMRSMAGTIIHEISHNFGAKDHTYKKSELKNVKWHKNAETYEVWGEDGFCIPGYDC